MAVNIVFGLWSLAFLSSMICFVIAGALFFVFRFNDVRAGIKRRWAKIQTTPHAF